MDLYERLINCFGGSQVAAAHALGVPPQVVANWKKRGLPRSRAFDIEDKTRGGVQAREVLEARRAAGGTTDLHRGAA